MPLLRVPLRLFPPEWRAASLERRTYPPGTRAELLSREPRVLYVESGYLTLAVAATGVSDQNVLL
jgi:hypothetical protein